MQTIYFTTSNFIRHTGNLVDFAEYRRRMEQGSGAPSRPVPPRRAEEPALPRIRIGGRSGILPDFCISAAVLLLTATVMIRFLMQ